MAPIKIEGFTELQVYLADRLWNCCTTQEEVIEVLNAYGKPAEVVYHMLVAASFDSLDDTDVARALLDQFRL